MDRKTAVDQLEKAIRMFARTHDVHVPRARSLAEYLYPTMWRLSQDNELEKPSEGVDFS